MSQSMYDLVESLKSEPQTYYTLLGELYGNNSSSRSLRRKLIRASYDGSVYRSLIPNSMFGKIMFYVPEKNYYLVYTKKEVYYCKNYYFKSIWMYLNDVKKLIKTQWLSVNNLKLDKELLLKIV